MTAIPSAPLYFDYQASTPLHPEVLERMLPFWKHSFGNPHSSEHVVGWAANKAVETARQEIANLIGADSNEIVFTSGATEANNLALFGACSGAAKRPDRNTILVSAIEHKCVLESAANLANKHGYQIGQIPVNEAGEVRLDAFDSMLSDEVQLVSVGLVNNEIGTIQDIAAISQLCRRHGVYLHTDGAQSPVAVSLENISSQVEMLSLSGHKMYGPMGIGVLYVSNTLKSQIEPLIWGGGQQFGVRAGTLPLPLCVGMGAAATLFTPKNFELMRQKISNIRNMFLESLILPGNNAILNGPPSKRRHPGNANIRFSDCDAQDMLMALQPDLCASTGSACSTGISESSHVLHAIGLNESEARSSIRFSIGQYTTEKHIIAAVDLVKRVLAH